MGKKNDDVAQGFSKEVIGLSFVKPGMQLADNVYDKNGTLLLNKGLVLGDTSINFIRRRGILAIKILKKDEIDTIVTEECVEEIIREDSVPTQITEECITPVIETKEFKTFNAAYSRDKARAEDLIRNISNGGIVDVEQIVTHTSTIMSQLDNKNDILSYLCYIEGTDDTTYGHSMNVSLLCHLFGEWLDLSKEELRILTVAGMLHDVGKTRIPDEIISKKSSLTDEEFRIIKMHPVYGYNILHEQNADIEIKLVAYMHHEKMDGSGYPQGIAGDKISKFASIVTICDIYDAMTSNRSYRKKICPFTIIDTFESKSYGELHTEYLLLFLKNIAHTYQNRFVRLSTGEVGEVIFINPGKISRPIVQVGKDTFINLEKDKSKSIVEVL